MKSIELKLEFKTHRLKAANKSYQNTFYRCEDCGAELGPYDTNGDNCPVFTRFLSPVLPSVVISSTTDINWIIDKTSKLIIQTISKAEKLSRQYKKDVIVPKDWFTGIEASHHNIAGYRLLIDTGKIIEIKTQDYIGIKFK